MKRTRGEAVKDRMTDLQDLVDVKSEELLQLLADNNVLQEQEQLLVELVHFRECQVCSVRACISVYGCVSKSALIFCICVPHLLCGSCSRACALVCACGTKVKCR